MWVGTAWRGTTPRQAKVQKVTNDAQLAGRDETTSWPTVTVPPGTWRLTRDDRLLYESLPAAR